MRRLAVTGARPAWTTLFLALRSLVWAALLPGVVAGYVPVRFFGLGRLRLDLLDPMQVAGWCCAGAGVVLLGACVWEFARSGRGTLAPVDAPRVLVVRGLYRYVRNPMYLSVSAIVLGEAIAAGSGALFLYWAVWFLAANLLVMGYEEPSLRRRFGQPYERYTRRVGRWLPRLISGPDASAP